MEESPFEKLHLAGPKGDVALRLVKTHRALREAIRHLEGMKSHPEKLAPPIEEDVKQLKQQIQDLLGSSFRLSWSTVGHVRLLHQQGLLVCERRTLTDLCKTVLASKDCSSPWQMYLHYEWLGHEVKLLQTKRFLLAHFVEASEDPDFVHLPRATLLHFLSCPDLRLDREVDAVRALLRWVQDDPSDRIRHVPALVEEVRLERLSPQEIAETDTAFRFLSLTMIKAKDTFQRRHNRFDSWMKAFGIRIFLALTLKDFELSELNVLRRRWELRRSMRCPNFFPETLTGSVDKLFVLGTEDKGLLFRNDEVDRFPLSGDFLGPMVYKFVGGQLFAVQNQGWRVQIWTKERSGWACSALRPASSWLYHVQLFANQDHLLIAGQRDKKAKPSQRPASSSISPDLFGQREPFLWTYHRKTKVFGVAAKFPSSNQTVQNLGATDGAFWVADSLSGRVWMADLNEKSWRATEMTFPVGHKVLCSCSLSSHLVILSCDTVRGSYLTLSMIGTSPSLQFGVCGSLPFEFSKSFANDFVNIARFHILSEFLPCF